jgi:hypothetical protein
VHAVGRTQRRRQNFFFAMLSMIGHPSEHKRLYLYAYRLTLEMKRADLDADQTARRSVRPPC